jgi:hypothetical protein
MTLRGVIFGTAAHSNERIEMRIPGWTGLVHRLAVHSLRTFSMEGLAISEPSARRRRVEGEWW